MDACREEQYERGISQIHNMALSNVKRSSVVKKLPRGKRDLIYKVIDSRTPLDLVNYLSQYLDD